MRQSGIPRPILAMFSTGFVFTVWRREAAGRRELVVALTHGPSSRLKKKVSLFESIPQTTRRFVPVHKENKHETGRTKKFAQAQETKEAPCFEKVQSGEEIKRGGSVTIED
jgi:hypothetical protein